jgi:hypothetical protein
VVEHLPSLCEALGSIHSKDKQILKEGVSSTCEDVDEP